MSTPAHAPLVPGQSYTSEATTIAMDTEERGPLISPGHTPAAPAFPTPQLLDDRPRDSIPPHTPAIGETPPGSPNQRLLTTPVQTPLYPPGSEKAQIWGGPRGVAAMRAPDGDQEAWTPVPLKLWFWLPLVLFMALGAIGLEIALHFTKKNNGWPTGGVTSTSAERGFRHYAYTLPPVAVAMVIVAMWAWTDIEIKKLQPYVDLVRGDSPAHRSLLLDYTRLNNFVVWTQAAANKHYIVAFATLMVLLTLTFQPLAASLLVVRDTWWTSPITTVNNLGLIGLNDDATFSDLTSFLTAAGYASAAVLYRLGDPAFVHDEYTIGPFELPYNIANNGTVTANTTAIKSTPSCRPSESVAMTQIATGWSNTASGEGCTISWSVDRNATNLFGATVPNCTSANYGSIPEQFRPVSFWFFTYEPSAAASVTFCTAAISLWDVTVKVDIATGNLTEVVPLRPFDSSYSNYSSMSATITGAPLNGRAYNGIDFPFAEDNRIVAARKEAIQLQLPAAVFQSAQTSPEGLIAVFGTNRFAQLSTQVYTMYLKLIAKSVYFVPGSAPLQVRVSSFRRRLWLSEIAVHLLATAMLLLALFGTLIHILHRRERRNLHLAHQPGTIASAVSIGAQTYVADALDGRQKESEFASALRNKRFRIDPRTMKIVLEGQEGFEAAASPDPRRSIFGFLRPDGQKNNA